ncbi:MAG: hypothetical protein HY328_16775 [Chloroflexi bacterium]|nr:hypothetical protein [Chloroflexota bacterium]
MEGKATVQIGYSYALEGEDIVLRVDKELVDPEFFARFLDYLNVQAMRRRSRLTEVQVEKLAAEVDRAVWQQLKSRVLPDTE